MVWKGSLSCCERSTDLLPPHNARSTSSLKVAICLNFAKAHIFVQLFNTCRFLEWTGVHVLFQWDDYPLIHLLSIDLTATIWVPVKCRSTKSKCSRTRTLGHWRSEYLRTIMRVFLTPLLRQTFLGTLHALNVRACTQFPTYRSWRSRFRCQILPTPLCTCISVFFCRRSCAGRCLAEMPPPFKTKHKPWTVTMCAHRVDRWWHRDVRIWAIATYRLRSQPTAMNDI